MWGSIPVAYAFLYLDVILPGAGFASVSMHSSRRPFVSVSMHALEPASVSMHGSRRPLVCPFASVSMHALEPASVRCMEAGVRSRPLACMHWSRRGASVRSRPLACMHWSRRPFDAWKPASVRVR